MAEFKAIVKASGLGMIIIGLVGFVIAIIVQLAGLS
jgi:protein translocase SEC61 complex gamma subunit